MLLREIFVPPPAGHCRGVGMPRCAEFYTQKPARRKASPGGEAGATFVATDEVEAIVHHHESVQNCYLRPHPSRFWRDTFPSRGRLWSVQTGNPYRPSSVCPYGQPLSRGMTATGSHIHFYSLRGAPPSRGRLFSVPEGVYVDFCRSNVGSWRARRASPLQCLAGGYTGIRQRTPPPSPSVTPPPYTGEPLFRRGNFFCIFLDFSMKLSQNCLEERESP